MAYEFKRLSNVEALPEVPKGATVLAEVGGEIKRVPGSGLGGGGIKTAIIKDSFYDETVQMMQTEAPAPSPTSAAQMVNCINMTFEEAYETMANGEPLAAYGMLTTEAPVNLQGTAVFAGIAAFGVPCIILTFMLDSDFTITLFWTADGLLTEPPYAEEK